MVHFDVIVIVPRLAFAGPDLNESNAAFDQSSRGEKLARLRAFAVHLANVLRLFGSIERISRVHLHAIGEFVRFDAGFELGVFLPLRGVAVVERVEEVELFALFGQRRVVIFNVLDELFDLGVLRVDVGALINARKEAALPVLRFLDGIAAGAHRDEAGQILVLSAQTVGDP